MPFLDHLEELRWRILWSVLSIAVCSGIGFALVFYFELLNLLILPVKRAVDDPAFQLIYLSPADPFFIQLKLGIFLGLILASPVVIYQAWAFLSPALEAEERKTIVPALYMGLVLFAGGVAMAYFAALPVTLEFFERLTPASMVDQLEVRATLGFITKMLFAFGIVFELPVVVMILTAMGLVTPDFLRSKRRHAVVIITALAAFITPGDIIVLTLMMMVPLILLYELSIFLSAGIHKRRMKRMGEPLEPSPDPPPDSVQAEG